MNILFAALKTLKLATAFQCGRSAGASLARGGKTKPEHRGVRAAWEYSNVVLSWF